MKILLSAYSCAPNWGSEPGVGWSWTQAWAKDNDVYVILHDSQKEAIEKYLAKNSNQNLHFIYVGLSKKLTFWKKGRRGMRPYMFFWQRKAARIAKELNEKLHFDFIQHVTFANYTMSTYMYKLGVPLIFGPVAGRENIPDGIKLKMTAAERILEKIRKLSQVILFPCIKKTMQTSKIIFAATEETKQRIPEKYHDKTYILPAIGMTAMPPKLKEKRNDAKSKIIMCAGRLLFWKAFDIGIRAFLEIADAHPQAELHILGEGPKKKELINLAGKYLNKQVFFEAPVEHNMICEFYSSYDIFLNTSLRDSGCMALMEAMSVGLPCLAVATGGPGLLLADFPDCQIKPGSYSEIVARTAEKLHSAIANKALYVKIGAEMRKHIQDNFLYSGKVEKVKEIFYQATEKQTKI